MFLFSKKIIAATFNLSVAGVLAGCAFGTPATTGSATAIPATVIAGGATPQPTAVPSTGDPQPTAVPSTGDPQPTTVPAAKPTIDFQPRGGKADTTIAVRGWGFAPNSRIAIRIGLPQAVGEVLGTIETDAAGAGTAQVVVPGVLPSGDPITTANMRIVAMDEGNVSLASAPFAFEPAPVDAQPVYGFANSPEEATKYMLDSLLQYPNGRQAFAYASPALFNRYGNGGAHNMLQLQNPFQSYTIDGVVASTDSSQTVQATFNTGIKLQFVAVTDRGGGFWLVDQVINLPL